MKRLPRLNLSALRNWRLPRPPRAGLTAVDLLDSQARLAFSRREMLGLAGTAAASLPLKFGGPQGRLQFVPGRKRVAFKLDGSERWAIDTRRFAGHPILRTEQHPRLIRMALLNARYPGTNLPADMKCELTRVGAGWRLQIKLALGGFDGAAPFEPWLRGETAPRSIVNLDESVQAAPESATFRLAGRAQAEFSPNWTLRLKGKGIARLDGFGGPTVSDSVVLALLSPEEPSVLRRPAERRTLLAMNRGGRSWPFQPRLGPGNTSGLAVSDTSFDRIRIETGEDASGNASRSLVAESPSGIAFVPPGDFWADGGAPLRLPLRNARYAIVSDSAGHHAALVAGYGHEPVWIHTNGCSFEVGGSEDASAFEAVSANGQLPRVTCAPPLRRISAPLPGVAVEPGALKPGTQLAFLAAPEPPQSRIKSETIPAEIFRHKITKKKKKKKKAPKIKLNKKLLQMRLREQKANKRRQSQHAPVKVLGKVVPQTHESAPVRLLQQKATEQRKSQQAPVKVLGKVVPQTREPAPQTHVTVPPRIHIHPAGGGVVLQVQHPRRIKKVRPHITAPSRPEPNLAFDFIRPDDLLALKFEFYNLTLSAGAGQPSLTRVQPNQLAYVVVQFWPQHVAEEAFIETSSSSALPPQAQPPITSRVAGPSRLAFIVPGSVTEIPYTVKSLLDWAQYEQSVTPLATPPKPQTYALPNQSFGSAKRTQEPQTAAIQKSPQYYRQIEPHQSQTRQPSPLVQGMFAGGQLIQFAQVKEPGVLQTSIEAPYRMIVSPSYYAGWAHATNPVSHQDRVELWHTRLGVRTGNGAVDEREEFYRTLRAVWATDYPGGCRTDITKNLTVFNTPSITTDDRYQIVRLSSDPTIVYPTKNGQASYVPQPIQVNRLMLSTLGAWMNTEGNWTPPEDVVEPACKTGKFSFDLENWRHIAAMGRDQYVRIIKEGFLFPFGHRAVQIIITERKFHRTPDGTTVGAYLRQQTFVVVRQHEKTYPATGQPNPLGPQLPFRAVRIHTLSTPALSGKDPVLPPEVRYFRVRTRHSHHKEPPPPPPPPGAFWPLVDGEDFQFKMEGVDWEGHVSEFTAPLIFVGVNEARDAGQSAKVMAKYNTDVKLSRRVRPFYGQKVAYAKHKVPGDTTLETDSMSFKGQTPAKGTSLPPGLPYFYPAMSLSQVRIATVERLTGVNASTAIQYDAAYLEHGIESLANKGQVFAKLLNTVPLLFGGSGGSADKVGGLLTPSMEISGLSRLLGPVAGQLESIASGAFDPAKFFKSALEAKLLGDISLEEVIKAVTDFSGTVEKIPKFVTSHLHDKIVTSFTWQPEIQSVSIDKKNGIPPFFVVTGDPTKALTVNATLTKTLDAKPPSYVVNASLKSFKIDFIPTASKLTDVMVLTFDELTFKSVNGQKPDVKVHIKSIEFKGPLAFVNPLKDMIPSGGGFDDPPSLDVTAEGIEAGYSLGLPPVSIGVFNLSNLSLGAQLNIYFTGAPITFQFDFCQEHHPFLLTVSLFGGGGYFGLTLTPKGIQRMEAEFEFGGNFSLNIGVASGGIYLMAGLSYKHENSKTELTGYLRCGGAVEVLAIITVSVEFKMSLKYISDGNKLWGRATLTVQIDILFFSKSVDLTVERQFAGGGNGHAALLFPGAPYPLGPTAVSFSDEMSSADWEIYCEAFA